MQTILSPTFGESEKLQADALALPPTPNQMPARSSQQMNPNVLCGIAVLNLTSPCLVTDGETRRTVSSV